MERIENLDVLVLAAERMRDTFRAFEQIPEVLQALQAAQNYPDELDKAILAKKEALDNLDLKLKNKEVDFKVVEKAVADCRSELANLEKESEKRVKEVKAEEEKKSANLKKSFADAVKEAEEESELIIDKHRVGVAVSEANMNAMLAEHQAQVDAKMKELEELEDKIAVAQAKVAKIKASLEV